MRILSYLELCQRLILVAMPAWLAWSLMIWLAAPYKPGGFLFIIFLCSLLFVYLGCVWAASSIVPDNSPVIWQIFLSASLGALPFLVIVVLGHFIGNLILVYMS